MPKIIIIYTEEEKQARDKEGEAKGCASCPACKHSFFWKELHHTVYEDSSQGNKSQVALCEECWAGMAPEQRVPYYEAALAGRPENVRPVIRRIGLDGQISIDPKDEQRYEREVAMAHNETMAILEAVRAGA